MAMQKCDVLISCGARFDDRVTGKVSAFSPHSKKIHIDIDPSSIGKIVRVDVPIVGDVKRVLTKLAEKVPKAKHDAWRKQILEWDHTHPLNYQADPEGDLKPQHLIRTLHKLTKGEAIIATGVGQHQMWAMQWYNAKFPRHFLTSGGLGTMGYGFPAAIGARLGNPDQTVICIDGDGCFQMTMAEMATVIHERIKVIVIVINNYYLGMVRQWQELFYNERFSASSLVSAGGKAFKGKEPDQTKIKYIPDFVKFAEAYGALGLRITKNKEAEPAILQALKHDGPVIIEAVIPHNEKVFPMVPAGAALDEIIVDMA